MSGALGQIIVNQTNNVSVVMHNEIAVQIMTIFLLGGVVVVAEETRKGFSFVPRRLVKVPASFGQISDDLEPAGELQTDDPRVRAALLQHHMSNAVREYLLKDPSRNLAWFASEDAGHPGVSVARMRRMLRGETQMQLTDVTFITSKVPGARDFAIKWLGFDLQAKNREIQDAAYQVQRAEVKLSRCTCGAAG